MGDEEGAAAASVVDAGAAEEQRNDSTGAVEGGLSAVAEPNGNEGVVEGKEGAEESDPTPDPVEVMKADEEKTASPVSTEELMPATKGKVPKRNSFLNLLPKLGSMGAGSRSSMESDRMLDGINNDLLHLNTTAKEILRRTEDAVQEGLRRTEGALRETGARLAQRVRDSEQAFKDAQQRMGERNLLRETQSNIADGVRDAHERLREAQMSLQNWQENRLKAFFEPVPFAVPLYRRRQTFAVMLWTFLFLFPGPMVWTLIGMVALLSRYTSFFLLTYLVIIFTWDSDAFYTGRRKPYLRGLRVWRHMAEYFPTALVKTAHLDPERRYIFGIHPHGVISIGAFVNFATDGTGFSLCFPGVDVRLCTLDVHFFTPFCREFLLGCGMVGASRRTFRTFLSDAERSTAGNGVAVVVGGAAEALEASPGDYTLVLDKRKGFVRMALETGSCLVPVISFGENSLYRTVDNPVGSALRKFQDMTKSISGIAPVLFHGRGAFNYAFGSLPFRKPIVTVIGAPIEIPKYVGDVYNDDEGKELTDKYHKVYVSALSSLFEEHVALYDPHYKSFSVK